MNYLLTHQYLFLLGVLIVGLLVGHCLNRLIQRLPLSIEAETRPGTLDLVIKSGDDVQVVHTLTTSSSKTFSSHQEWIVILTSCVVFILLAHEFNASLKFIGSLILAASLISLFFIDMNTLLLPDQITLPTLWLGLLCNNFSLFTSLSNAVLGAISGYLFFYLINAFMLKIRKINSLGGGDLKLLSMLGAWFGYQALPTIILIASTIGALFAGFYIFYKKEKLTLKIPFGPFLCLAGFFMLKTGVLIIL